MFRMQDGAKKNIEAIVGVSTKKISRMSVCGFDRLMEKKLGKKVYVVSRPDPRLTGRGSPLISMGRLSYTEEIDRKIKKIYESINL